MDIKIGMIEKRGWRLCCYPLWLEDVERDPDIIAEDMFIYSRKERYTLLVSHDCAKYTAYQKMADNHFIGSHQKLNLDAHV